MIIYSKCVERPLSVNPSSIYSILARFRIHMSLGRCLNISDFWYPGNVGIDSWYHENVIMGMWESITGIMGTFLAVFSILVHLVSWKRSYQYLVFRRTVMGMILGRVGTSE